MKDRICKARQVGDQYLCDQCGVTWDIDDKDPPPCNPEPPQVDATASVLFTLVDVKEAFEEGYHAGVQGGCCYSPSHNGHDLELTKIDGVQPWRVYLDVIKTKIADEAFTEIKHILEDGSS